MALVPAKLSLNWNSNYAGPTRVCYKIVGAPTFTCTVPGVPGPGFHPVCGLGPCSYDIDIMVDNETCAQVDYEIYVQPACETEVSAVGRVTLAPALSFIPSPACKRWEVTCVDSVVDSIALLGGGSGYTDNTYNELPAVGGGGVGATFDVVVAGGIVTSMVLNAAGSGYTSVPLVDLSSIPYTPGTEATYLVSLAGCTALAIYDCSGTTSEILAAGTLQPTDTYEMCGPIIPPVPSDFTILENGNCLCNCIEQDIQETGAAGTIDYVYIDCDGNSVSGQLTASQTTGNVCMVDGSLSTIVAGGATETIVVVGPCDAV